MKLWIDDVRLAPEGYHWCKSVNEAKVIIEQYAKKHQNMLNLCNVATKHSDYGTAIAAAERAKIYEIKLIDIDHDAGEFASDGGDYIRLLDWLEEHRLGYPIRIHSMNPVGIQNMRAIIRKNGWKEVR